MQNDRRNGWRKITPAMAKKWLAEGHKNRPLSERRAADLADEMRRGQWEKNGEAIVFDRTGRLIDGQHRLMACVISGAQFEAMCVFGVEADTFYSFDRGSKRTLSDVAAVMGVKNYTTAAAMARWKIIYDRVKTGGRWPTGRADLVPAWEFEAFVERHRDFLSECAQEFVKNERGIGRITTSRGVVAGVFFGAAMLSRNKAFSWLKLLASGSGIDDETHPVLTLRNRLADIKGDKKKPVSYEVSALCVKGFSMYAQGRRAKIMRWSMNEPFPLFSINPKDPISERA